VPAFTHDGLRLWYSERGDPDGPPLVLLHGLFFSRRMYERLAQRLPGHRTLMLDLRGHGKSSRPRTPAAYRWDELAGDVLALLDHLGIERAVIGGLSLGANVALVLAVSHPERTTGLIIEMPVLDHSRRTAYRAFRPLRYVLSASRAGLAPLTHQVRHLPVPGRWPEVAAARDLLGVQPEAGAALLEGLLTDVDPPHDAATLGGITVPTLVIGHHLDGLHALDDARHVADSVPGAELVSVVTIADLRLRARRYAQIVDRFLERNQL